MSTQPVSQPMMPDTLRESIGLSAQQRVEILEQKMTALELQGDIKPATILNLSPFALSLSSGLIPYKIPASPVEGKPLFSATTIRTVRSYPIFKGKQEMSDKSLQAKYDVNILLPVQQLMEFRHYYVGETEEDQAVKQGGVVVFEGEAEHLTPKLVVKTPRFIFRKRNRYIVYEEATLGSLIEQADLQLRNRCMHMLDQASHWWDNEKQRANIQRTEHIWHDFALRRQWITQGLPWRTTHTPEASRCPRCGKQYVSKTGVCGCSFVVDPYTAYMTAEIGVDHVRMNSLNEEQWAAVRKEEARREKARGGK